MRVAILGAGPAGLYFAYLMKRARPDFEISLFEQNPSDATFGFGIAFSARALEFLQAEDAATWAAIEPSLERWNDSLLYLNGEKIRIDGIGYAGIGRLRLLQILQERARMAGVRPIYNHAVAALTELEGADLIVGADGVNSLVRQDGAAGFGTSISYLTNRFAWYGTPKRFEALSHSFVETSFGFFNAHFHRHAPDMSTFVIEVDEPTFLRCGFGTMELDEARDFCARIFADVLGDAPLISNKSIWRRFPKIENASWSCENRVLIGDALHTAHFSIGSGTRLAMEDAIALCHALEIHGTDIRSALADFEKNRRPPLTRLVAAADASAQWYEHFADHMRLPPLDFAMSYITRSGRVDLERLRKTSPQFMAAYETHGFKT
ncbi:MAG TPA: FAD-dependent monooxygenase [Micropepsaceae bacterium]|jgi:2-polyprenyl-6-methoxyphenol hydroxylase-like FAD-dependent oxidoreductase|nr:FAD-dependent monooxygenase [Micropepsaceae bacterium]